MKKNTVKNLIAGSLAVLLTSGVSGGQSEAVSATEFEAAYHRLKDVSRREALRLTQDQFMVDELAHDTITHVLLESRRHAEFLFKSPDEQARIVKTATRNRHLDRLKMERRHRARLEAAARIPPEERLAPSAEDVLSSVEERTAAETLLDSITREEEIVSRYLNGHSMNRIHAELKVSRHRIVKVLKSAAHRFFDGRHDSPARRLAS